MTPQTMADDAVLEDLPDDLDVPEDAPAAGPSLLDQLKRRREEAAGATTEVFEVPNNGGILWARYQLLPWRRVRQLAGSVEQARKKDPLAELKAAATFLSEACEEMLLRDPESGALRPLDASDPVRYDQRLCQMLDVELPPGAKVHDVVRLVLGPGGRDLAVTSHQAEVQRWMENSNAEAEDAAAGGS